MTKATALSQQELGVKPQSVGIELFARIERWIKTALSVPLRYNLHYGRVVKLAATADSKSAEGNLMSVRLRPRPPSTASFKINAKIRQDRSIRLRPILVENGTILPRMY
jgi:hypothetical protein